MKTNLYLLSLPDRRLCKVGKADDVDARIKQLRRDWGQVDYNNSYVLQGSPGVVFRLEATLKFLLKGRAIRFDEGDGRTELFDVAALDTALRHVDLFCSMNSGVYMSPMRDSMLKLTTAEENVLERIVDDFAADMKVGLKYCKFLGNWEIDARDGKFMYGCDKDLQEARGQAFDRLRQRLAGVIEYMMNSRRHYVCQSMRNRLVYDWAWLWLEGYKAITF